MAEKQQTPEGNLSLRFDLPASLKARFDQECKTQNKTMTEVTISLIKQFLGDVDGNL